MKTIRISQAVNVLHHIEVVVPDDWTEDDLREFPVTVTVNPHDEALDGSIEVVGLEVESVLFSA